MKTVVLSEVVHEAKPGFACGIQEKDGVFQFRMHNVSKSSDLVLASRRRVPRSARNDLHSFYVRPGDVLFNATNSPDGVGKSVLVPELDEPAVFSNHFVRLRTDEAVLDSAFLWRWLQLQYQRGVFLAMCKQWVNQAAVSRESLLNLTIDLPTLDEQLRIAAILDQADALRAKRRQILAHLDSLTQSIFHDMFGSRTDLPVAPLSEIVREGTSVTYGIVQAGPEFEGGIPYIRTGDIVDGRISTERLRRTDPSIAARFVRSAVNPGDIVMSIRATVGTTAVVPKDLDGANLTQGTARIAPGARALGLYLLGRLRHAETQNWIQRQVKGATFREITLRRLRDLPVPLPPLPDQVAYAHRVARLDATVVEARGALKRSDELFASLQSRAFQGEL